MYDRKNKQSYYKCDGSRRSIPKESRSDLSPVSSPALTSMMNQLLELGDIGALRYNEDENGKLYSCFLQSIKPLRATAVV